VIWAVAGGTLGCAAGSDVRWQPAPPTAAQRTSLVSGIQAAEGAFAELHGVRVGMSIPEAEQQLGEGWSCRRLGRRSWFWDCSHGQPVAPLGIGLEVREDRITSISMHWPSAEDRSSACREFDFALRELIQKFGEPMNRDTRLCQDLQGEPSYVPNCASWRLGDSGLVLAASPSLEGLRQVHLGINIGPARTAVCDPPRPQSGEHETDTQ
jgi:hypothetical protein